MAKLCYIVSGSPLHWDVLHSSVTILHCWTWDVRQEEAKQYAKVSFASIGGQRAKLTGYIREKFSPKWILEGHIVDTQASVAHDNWITSTEECALKWSRLTTLQWWFPLQPRSSWLRDFDPANWLNEDIDAGTSVSFYQSRVTKVCGYDSVVNSDGCIHRYHVGVFVKSSYTVTFLAWIDWR